MKSSVRVCLGLVAASAALAFVGCGDDDTSGPGAGGTTAHGGAEAHGGAVGHGGATGHGGEAHGEGDLTCEVLGKLCHESDTGSGAGYECHELGHVGNADACAEGFDGCIAVCVAAGDGAGGQGSGGAAAVPTVDPRCAALGELCHPVDDEDGPLHACHELGHVGNAATCAASFDDCATLCLAAREELEGAAGGAGGGAGTGGVGTGGTAGATAGAGGEP